MTLFWKKVLFLIGVMVCLTVFTFGVARVVRRTEPMEGGERIRIVTSFYPMYLLTANLAAQSERTEVTNLTENHTGCLHDYQLTTEDMRTLSRADALVLNGGGMEPFLEEVLEARPGLSVLTACEEPSSSEEEENAHVWLNVERYRQQARRVTEQLSALFPEEEESYRAGLAAYDERLSVLSREAERLSRRTAGVPVVVFHEAFSCLAESLGMEVLQTMALDEDTVPSAGEIAEAIEKIRRRGFALILIEEDYISHAEKLLARTDAVVVCLDPLVGGDPSPDSYERIMKENFYKLEAALGE